MYVCMYVENAQTSGNHRRHSPRQRPRDRVQKLADGHPYHFHEGNLEGATSPLQKDVEDVDVVELEEVGGACSWTCLSLRGWGVGSGPVVNSPKTVSDTLGSIPART